MTPFFRITFLLIFISFTVASFGQMPELITPVGHFSAEEVRVYFIPDGNKIITTAEDKVIKVWDVQSGKILHTFEGHDSEILGLIFSEDGTKIATETYKEVIIWDLEKYKKISVLSNSNWVPRPLWLEKSFNFGKMDYGIKIF